MKVKKNKILTSALTLGLGTFVAKVLGAIYRIPLTKNLGGVGIGLYQMVFPTYTVLLDFSGAGAPNALSKLISSYVGEDRENYAYNYLILSLKLFLVLGLICTLLMGVFSKTFSSLQGNVDATLGYLFLSPAVFFVCIVSSFRGYFQGRKNMRPTAISQVIEQLVKLVFGLFLSYIFLPNVKLAVAGTTGAITISEIVAGFVLFVFFMRTKKREKLRLFYQKDFGKTHIKTLIKTVIPITLIGVIIPLSNVADSFITINILNGYAENSTTLFGLLSGVAMTVIGLPVSICYGISTACIPFISSAEKREDKYKNAVYSLLLTLVCAIPCAVIIYVFTPNIINILFRSLGFEEKNIVINLLKLLSPTVVFLSFLQTQNAVLIGQGKFYSPIVSMIMGVGLKIILDVALIKNQSLNIYGGAIAVIACYFVINLINLFMIFTVKVTNERKATNSRISTDLQ